MKVLVAGGNGVKIGLLIDQAGNATRLRVHRNPQKLVFQRVTVCADLHPFGLARSTRAHIDHLVAKGRDIRH